MVLINAARSPAFHTLFLTATCFVFTLAFFTKPPTFGFRVAHLITFFGVMGTVLAPMPNVTGYSSTISHLSISSKANKKRLDDSLPYSERCAIVTGEPAHCPSNILSWPGGASVKHGGRVGSMRAGNQKGWHYASPSGVTELWEV